MKLEKNESRKKLKLSKNITMSTITNNKINSKNNSKINSKNNSKINSKINSKNNSKINSKINTLQSKSKSSKDDEENIEKEFDNQSDSIQSDDDSDSVQSDDESDNQNDSQNDNQNDSQSDNQNDSQSDDESKDGDTINHVFTEIFNNENVALQKYLTCNHVNQSHYASVHNLLQKTIISTVQVEENDKAEEKSFLDSHAVHVNESLDLVQVKSYFTYLKCLRSI